MNAKASPRHLSIEAAADEIGVSPWTLRSWVRARRIGCVRAGRRVLIPVAEVEAFLDRHRIPARDAERRDA